MRSWDAALVEPGLQVRLRPRGVKPVARIAESLAGLVRNGLIVRADGLEERVASARSGVRNAMVVKEGLELRLGPSVSVQLVRAAQGQLLI